MKGFLKKLQRLNILKILNLSRFKIPTICLFVFGVFIGFNVSLSPVSFLRLDLSFGKAYTLSPSTKKIIKNLDKPVTITFFVSSNLPTRLLPLKNEVGDLLNEYLKENKGKMNVKVFDPKKDQNALKKVQELGIPELQFSQLEQNKYAVTASYFGIAVSYQDKNDVLPQVTDIESLEYNLTAMMYKMTKKELEKIGILGQQDSFNPQEDSLATFKKVMSQQYDVVFIDLSDASAIKEIDQSYKTIFVFDTDQKEYAPQEVEAIKTYINKGGKAVFLVDGVWVQDNLSTGPAKHNLFPLLADYGIKVNTNLILSANAELVNFGNGTVSFLSPYPFWVKTDVFNSKTSYFSNIQQLTFPWVSSVEGNVLVKTSQRSWEQKNNFTLNPEAIVQPKVTDLRELAIVAESKNKNVFVIPSSRFIYERFLTRTSDNLEFILNVANDFASNGALSGIRQRVVSFYPLPDLPDNQKDIFKYANMLTLPVLFGILGAIRLMKRR